MHHIYMLVGVGAPLIAFSSMNVVFLNTACVEKIVATSCGENKEERTCGYLLLVINQIVAITVVTAMHLWRGGLRQGTKHSMTFWHNVEKLHGYVCTFFNKYHSFQKDQICNKKSSCQAIIFN